MDHSATAQATGANTEAGDSSRLGGIDALRCFAMTAVIAEHCKILPFGWVGVWLFFVISGYVVTNSLLRHDDRAPSRTRIAHFFARRTARIFPAYFLYIALGFAFMCAAGRFFEYPAALSLAFFYNNFAMIFGKGELSLWPVGHLWTISVEMQFYIVYGLAFPFLNRRSLTTLLLSMILISPVLRLAASFVLPHLLSGDEAMAYAVYAGSFFHFDSFAVGALIALHPEFFERAWRSGRLFLGFLPLIAYAAAYVAINAIVRHEGGTAMFHNVVSGILYGQYRQVFLYSAVAAACGVIVVLAASSKTRLARWLDREAFVWIGKISYGGYLYHAMVIHILMSLFAGSYLLGGARAPFGHVVIFLLAYPMILAIAWVSYSYFEQPIIRRMGRCLREDVPARPVPVSRPAFTVVANQAERS